jgi:hypothetical protein
MSLPIIALLAPLAFTGGEMPVSLLSSPEARTNHIEQQQLVEGNQGKDITYTMGKSDIVKEMAVNKRVESPVFASLPQLERTQSALAVYTGREKGIDSSTPNLVGSPDQFATRIENKQWGADTAQAPSERPETGNLA